MTLWLVYLFIQTIRSHENVNPLDLTCTKRDYRLITDQSSYIFTSNNSSITVHAEIGRDRNRVSSLLTELWYEEINEQTLLLRSSDYLDEINGELDPDRHHSWSFQLSSMINRSGFNREGLSDGFLHIQSTTFDKDVDLLLRNEQSPCSSSRDVALCCGLCAPKDSCPEIEIIPEHTRDDMIVTNHGLVFPQFDHTVRCLLFPSSQTNRFWSTVTNAMNIGQTVDQNDLMIVQHPYGMMAKFFYYSMYPFDHWEKMMMKFDFLDVIFLPHRQLVLFQLKKSNDTNSQLLLQIYHYQLNRTPQIHDQLSTSEIIIEENTSTSAYFHLYFSMLSNTLYLIGQQTIYTSNNYGRQLTRVWTGDASSNDSIIRQPVIFSNTGHIAFIYRHNKHPTCCYYYAVFTKAGLYHGWRTRTFRSVTEMNQPFFFDASGSFYFNSTPPLLIIQATEQSLVPTVHLVVNRLPGPLFVRETDMNRWFVFCSLSSWDNRFGLEGSTIRFDKLGLFFVIKVDTSLCLHVSRLTDEPLRIARQCPLTIHSSLHLQLFSCVFDLDDENSTLVIPRFPSNIFVEKIINQTFAIGRIFEKVTFNTTQVNQWNLIRAQTAEQILDRCLLKSFPDHYLRPTLINIPPASLYPITNDDPLIVEQVHFLVQNDYRFIREALDTQQYLLTSSFNHRKSIVHLEYPSSQLSCYIPSSRTITFLTQCLPDMKISIHFNRWQLPSVDPPINLHWNRHLAGFESVIVYNLDDEKNSVCDGLKNCSCVPSWISFDQIHCAEQLYTMDSTVDNRISMELYMEKRKTYRFNNRSVFLIEEVSNRSDYRLIGNPWTKKVQKELVHLFSKNRSQLSENEVRVLQLLNSSLTKQKAFFFGANLEIELLDEGLYHFRLTYLWGDQFCLSSVDLLILLMSNTATLTSYTFTYFLACIVVLITMFILWGIHVLFYERLPSADFRRRKNEIFFKRRAPNDRINFEMLVKLREQSSQLLPYSYLIKENRSLRAK